jgi:hypothetical protein
MEQRVHLITLGVGDVARSRDFYVDGLGWPSALDVPGEITFVRVGHGLLLGLFGARALDADMGRAPGTSRAPAPFSLARIVATEAEVEAQLAAAQAAGGELLKAAQPADFGGFHGYFADPDGFACEVATNPGWSVAADGTVSIRPVV